MSVSLSKPAALKQYHPVYDCVYGSWGVWDDVNGCFVGHSSTRSGVRIIARKMNTEGK